MDASADNAQRPKKKKMNSIKKLGKFLGFASSKNENNNSKNDHIDSNKETVETIEEEEDGPAPWDLEHGNSDYHEGSEFDLRTPLSHIMKIKSENNVSTLSEYVPAIRHLRSNTVSSSLSEKGTGLGRSEIDVEERGDITSGARSVERRDSSDGEVQTDSSRKSWDISSVCAKEIATKSLKASLADAKLRLWNICSPDLQLIMEENSCAPPHCSAPVVSRRNSLESESNFSQSPSHSRPSSPVKKQTSEDTRPSLSRPLSGSMDRLHFNYEAASTAAQSTKTSATLEELKKARLEERQKQRKTFRADSSWISSKGTTGGDRFRSASMTDPPIAEAGGSEGTKNDVRHRAVSTDDIALTSPPRKSLTADKKTNSFCSQRKTPSKSSVGKSTGTPASGGWNSSTKNVHSLSRPLAAVVAAEKASVNDSGSIKSGVSSKVPGSGKKTATPGGNDGSKVTRSKVLSSRTPSTSKGISTRSSATKKQPSRTTPVTRPATSSSTSNSTSTKPTGTRLPTSRNNSNASSSGSSMSTVSSMSATSSGKSSMRTVVRGQTGASSGRTPGRAPTTTGSSSGVKKSPGASLRGKGTGVSRPVTTSSNRRVVDGKTSTVNTKSEPKPSKLPAKHIVNNVKTEQSQPEDKETHSTSHPPAPPLSPPRPAQNPFQELIVKSPARSR